MVLRFILSMVGLCVASFHEQYRVPQTCTDKWESFVYEDKEYVIQNLPITWENAKIMCIGHHNGTLANLDTKEKTEFLAEALAESQFVVDSVWVGARRNGGDDPDGYRWGNLLELRRTATDIRRSNPEDPDQYPSWQNRTHVPVPDSGADCVAIQRISHDRGVFLDLPCELERPFVCERDARTQQLIKELKTVRCRTGLYRMYDGLMDWHQAAAYCVLRKMSLANIASMKCLKKLGTTMLKTRPSMENAWIGAKGELGKWQWVDSGASIFTPSLYSDVDKALWPPMRDRASVKQNGCLQLDRHATHKPVFLEARCERKMQFICYQGIQASPALRTATVPPSDDIYYYVLVKQLLFWHHAYENCIKMNGVLAYPETPEIMTQLLLVMGENKEEPIKHIWISGRLNITKDVVTDDIKYSWYNPLNNKLIPDPKNNQRNSKYMAPWLDEDISRDTSCLNLDRQDHLTGLLYGLACDTPQYSICMIEKNARVKSEPVPATTQAGEQEKLGFERAQESRTDSSLFKDTVEQI